MEELRISLGKRKFLSTEEGSIVFREEMSFWAKIFKRKINPEEELRYDCSQIGHLYIRKYSESKLISIFRKNKYFVSFGQFLKCSNGDIQYIPKSIFADSTMSSRLKEYIESYKPLYMREDSFVHHQNIKPPAKCEEVLWCNSDYIVYTRMNPIRKGIKVRTANISNTLFFSVHKGKSSSNQLLNICYDKLNLMGKIYFGGDNGDISIQYLDESFTEKLKNYIIKNGSPIGSHHKDCTKYEGHFSLDNLFKPKTWGLKERIGFTDDAILFEKATKKYLDQMYLPYDKCYVVLHSKGLLGQKLRVYGLMNIITTKRFDKEIIEKVFAEAKSHGLDANANGKSVRSTYLWWNWLLCIATLGIYHNAKVVEGEKVYVFTRGARGNVRSNNSGNTGTTTGYKIVLPKDCTSVTYCKNHWYSLFGTLTFNCISVSIRDDQSDSASITATLEKVWSRSGKEWNKD